jgi:hypothetical protein
MESFHKDKPMSLIRVLTYQSDGLFFLVRCRCDKYFLVLTVYFVRVKLWWSYQHFLCSGINERQTVTRNQLFAY